MSNDEAVGVSDKRVKALEEILDGVLKQLQLTQQRVASLEATLSVVTQGRFVEPTPPNMEDGSSPTLTINVPKWKFNVVFNAVDAPKPSLLATAKNGQIPKLVTP